MLIYPNSFSGFGLLFTCAGSALPRAMVPALVSTVWAGVLEATIDWNFVGRVNDNLFNNPIPFQLFASMVGFALVFRTNVAYNRYWEGVTHFKNMTRSWGDAQALIMGYDVHTKTPEAKATRDQFAAFASHRFSLLHALACAHLRREVEFRLDSKSAPATPMAHSCYEDGLLQRRSEHEGSCCLSWRSVCRMLWNFSNFWKACKHSTARYENHLARTPLQVLGGVTDHERLYLARLDSEARVNACFTQTLSLCNRRRAAGGVQVDPPVLSRFHHELCNGMQGFQQACKLEDTPFPFPYAQIVSYVLAVFAISYPLVAVAMVDGIEGQRSWWLPPLMSFFCVLTYFGFHEVARELEDPFLHPPNELPMIAFHETFNTRLTATWEALDQLEREEADAPEGSEDVAAGLIGIQATPATALLESWKTRESGLQQVPSYGSANPRFSVASPPPLRGLPEDALLKESGAVSNAALELETAPPPTKQRRGSLAGGRKIKPPRSGSHVRNAVNAERLSFQLVSVP